MDSDSSSDAETGMLKKALHVEVPPDFDPSRVPQNGEEYLQSVMFETKRCQKVVVVPFDERKLKTVNYQIAVREECVKAPNETMIPSLEWQLERVKDFNKFSKFLASKNPVEGMNIEIQPTHWLEVLMGRSPKYSEIIGLGQCAKVKLLQVIAEEMRRTMRLERNMGMWMYSILATMEMPLSPEICHQLRELARGCSQIRALLPQDCDEEDLTRLNLAICLVARHFRQLDLADGGF